MPRLKGRDGRGSPVQRMRCRRAACPTTSCRPLSAWTRTGSSSAQVSAPAIGPRREPRHPILVQRRPGTTARLPIGPLRMAKLVDGAPRANDPPRLGAPAKPPPPVLPPPMLPPPMLPPPMGLLHFATRIPLKRFDRRNVRSAWALSLGAMTWRGVAARTTNLVRVAVSPTRPANNHSGLPHCDTGGIRIARRAKAELKSVRRGRQSS